MMFLTLDGGNDRRIQDRHAEWDFSCPKGNWTGKLFLREKVIHELVEDNF